MAVPDYARNRDVRVSPIEGTPTTAYQNNMNVVRFVKATSHQLVSPPIVLTTESLGFWIMALWIAPPLLVLIFWLN